MRLLMFLAAAIGCLAASAGDYDIAYLESTGNNGSTKIFAVTTPVKPFEVESAGDKAKLKPEELACREVLKAILFEGVDNFNDGAPLVADPGDPFALSLVNPKNKTFTAYFKGVHLENSPSNKVAFHYIVELNNYNLMRLLKMRGSIE